MTRLANRNGLEMPAGHRRRMRNQFLRDAAIGMLVVLVLLALMTGYLWVLWRLP